MLRRLDRAASMLNPMLALIAIGLGILNLVVISSFVVPLGSIHPRSSAACPSQIARGAQR